MLRSDDLVPTRAWDDLVKGSQARGKRLRRRRHALLAAPLAAVALAVASIPMSGLSHREGADVLVTDTADRPDGLDLHRVVRGPVAPPAERAAGAQRAGSAAPRTSVGSASTATGRSRGSTASLPPLPAVAPQRPDDAQVVAFSDPAGDADTSDGTVGGPANDPSRDIVGMRFAREPRGLRITMELAGDVASQGLYYGWMTDAKSQCIVLVHLGAPEDDGYYVRCDGVDSDFIRVASTPDSPRRLQAFIPYSSAPARIDLRRTLSELRGQDSVQQLGQGVVVDRATTTQSLGAVR